MPATLHLRRPVGFDSIPSARTMLRQLLAENAELLREVAELRALRELSYQDGLTGLGNRRYLEARLSEELARSRRTGGQVGALLTLDVACFRMVNDRFGRLIGDRALRWLARLIQETTRPRDVACRTGGDQFMVLLPDTDRAVAEQLETHLQTRIASSAGHRWLPMTVASGIVVWPAEGRNVLELVNHAAGVVAQTKRAGRVPVRMHLVR